MRKRAAGLAVFGLVLALTGTATAQQRDESGGVLLIMDASGSMGRVDDHGVRLIDGAKGALNSLVAALPEGAPIGLRVYGHRFPNTDRENGCTDSELIVPVGPLRHDEMYAAIEPIRSNGFTPIGLSLQAAAEDLDGAGTIVLVSDGEDTCAPPDPCEVAAELLAAGFELRVETIGFFLEDDAARNQLRCIAAATGGSYREVGDVDTLAAEMGTLVSESMPEIGRVHLPLQGGTTATAATSVPLRAPFGGDTGGGFTEFEGAYQTWLAPGVTEWFSIEAAAGIGVGVFGQHDGVSDGVLDGTIEVVMLDRHGNDAARSAPRSGARVADVALVSNPGPVFVGVTNATDFHGFTELEPETVESLAARGYDEQRYNEEWLAATLAPLEDPPIGGPYAVGFTWHTDQAGGRLSLGWGLSVTRQPVDLYGQVYEPLDGGGSATEATAFDHLTDERRFDAYRYPPSDDYPAYRSYHVGRVPSGTTTWYHQPMEFDEALQVNALVVDAEGRPVDDGLLELEIFDGETNDVGRPVPAATALDPSGAGALAAVSMVHDGLGDLPPSSYDGAWLAVTWTSPTGDAANVRLVVDVMSRYPGLSAPTPIQPDPTVPDPTVPDPTVAEELERPVVAEADATGDDPPARQPDESPADDGDGGGPGAMLLVVVVVVAAAVLGVAMLIVVRSVRSRHT